MSVCPGHNGHCGQAVCQLRSLNSKLPDALADVYDTISPAQTASAEVTVSSGGMSFVETTISYN